MNTHAPVQGKSLLDADGLGRTLSRIAHEIIEGNPELDDVALVDMNDFCGIRRELTDARAGHRLLPIGNKALMLVGAGTGAAS